MAARRGLDPDEAAAAELAGRDGMMAYSVDDLDASVGRRPLELIQVAIDAGAAFLPAAAMLVALWQRRGISAEDAPGHSTPIRLAALAREGQLADIDCASTPWLMMADLAKWTAKNYPHVTAVGVDTSPYHDAGATAAQDIAFRVATAVEYLRAMTDAGMDIDAAAEQILFRIGLGTHHFLAIAKLRAARQVWSRVVEACGGSDEARGDADPRPNRQPRADQRDPYVNLLAELGGRLRGRSRRGRCDHIGAVRRHDRFAERFQSPYRTQYSTRAPRRVSPASRDRSGGRQLVPRSTDRGARPDKAWEIFQETERQGGMLSALSRAVGSQNKSTPPTCLEPKTSRPQTGHHRRQRVSRTSPKNQSFRDSARTCRRLRGSRGKDRRSSSPGKRTISTINWLQKTGLRPRSRRQPPTVRRSARSPNAIGFHSGTTESITAIEPRNFAEPFEQLRDACDAWQATHGHRPRVFLANLGPVAHHTGRATWSKNFFEAGGFEVIGNNGFEDADAAAAAFAESGARSP